MSQTGFDGRACLASGSAPTSAMASYRVTIAAGSLRLGPVRTTGVALDVPVSRVRARPLGRAGSVVVDVDDSPLLLNFSEHHRSANYTGVVRKARRVVDAAVGRRHRGRFLRALRGAQP